MLTIRREMGNISNVIPAQAGNAYLYDEVGNRTSMMVTAGGGTKVHVYTYDNMMSLRAKRGNLQVTGVDYPTGFDPNLATDTTFNYDAADNRTSVIDGRGTCTYTSNNLNEYTAAGPVSYQHDPSGNLSADGTYTYYYDAENRLVKVCKSGPVPTTLAEALDLPLVCTTGGTRNWMVNGSDYHTGLSSAVSDNLNHAGEYSWLETTVQAVGDATLTFWWKSIEEGEDQSNTLEFRINGILQQNGTLYGNSGSWERRIYPLPAGTYTLRWTYTRHSQDDGGKGYVDGLTWTGIMPEPDPDAWRQLVYVYDAAGRRVEKQYDGTVVTKYVYDGDHCIAEYNGLGQLKRKYVFGPAVDEPICLIEETGSYAGTYYYHFDGLGSVVGLTNSSGNTVEVCEYDVYGRLGASDASHPNRMMFTGREYDKETGLYYYRARYYNPQIGRFLQTDPVGYSNGMNWYAYCGNGPATRSDPSGLSWEDSNIRIAFYNGQASDYFDPETGELVTGLGATLGSAASDPYFDIAIDLSKVRMAALLQGHALLDWIMREMPVLPGGPTNLLGPGPKLYHREDVHIEGVWIFDHGNTYGNNDTVLGIGTEKFNTFFQQFGAALDKNNGEGATINLRGCHSAVPVAGRGSAAEAAAKASGHTTTGTLGYTNYGESPWGKDNGPLYYCNEGYLMYVVQSNADGSKAAPWSRTPNSDLGDYDRWTWIYDKGYNPSNSSGYEHSHWVHQGFMWMY